MQFTRDGIWSQPRHPVGDPAAVPARSFLLPAVPAPCPRIPPGSPGSSERPHTQAPKLSVPPPAPSVRSHHWPLERGGPKEAGVWVEARELTVEESEAEPQAQAQCGARLHLRPLGAGGTSAAAALGWE